MEAAETIEIVILATSDVHGADMGRAASLIQEIRRTRKHVLLVDNGDLLQGTPEAGYAMKERKGRGHASIAAHNMLCYDAAVFGNHEFNYGLPALQQAVQESEFPWISANIVKQGTQYPYFGSPYIVKSFNGFCIAVLGLTTQSVPHFEASEHIAGLEFMDPVESAAAWTVYLHEKEQPDLLIVSYHGGFQCDPVSGELLSLNEEENQAEALAEIEGIDVIITGHQHLVCVDQSETGPLLIQTGTRAANIGQITITAMKQEDRWKLESKKVEILNTASYPEHPSVADTLKPLLSECKQWLSQPVGVAEGDWTITDPMRQVWLGKHPLIQWMNEVQMKAAGTDISCVSLLHPDIHGFRHVIRREDVLKVYPYPNTLSVLKISGSVMKAALEYTASFLTVDRYGCVSVTDRWMRPRMLCYQYDMWEGIEYEIDLTRKKGERITNLRYHHKPIAGSEEFEVTMNNYRAGGTGGYSMFRSEQIVREIPKEVHELLLEDIEQRRVLDLQLICNWRIRY